MEKSKGNNKTQDQLTEQIYSVFMQNPTKCFNYKQVCKQIDISESYEKQLVIARLEELCESEILSEMNDGKYKLKLKASVAKGIVDLTSKGYAYIVSKDTNADIFVASHNLNHALHGDEVLVQLFAQTRKTKIEGEVIEITKASDKILVGVVEISQGFAFVVSDNKNMPYDIYIPTNKLKGAKSGQKVTVKVIDWPEKAKNPIGNIIEVLGNPGDHETEMHAILAEFGLPYRYPEAVAKDAEKFTGEITEEEIAKRRDFRKITTFTIDPVDAKDFDDALSIQKLGNGNWEIGVHIADVTHYVQPGDIIDKEGYNE